MKKKIDISNSCEGKTKYYSLNEASEAANHFNRSGNKNRMMAYQCNYCGSYHFGHTRKRRELKLVNKVKRQKKRLDPKEFAGLTVNINQGYCLIKLGA